VPENNFTLVSICGIKDPVRKEVPNAVRECQMAGITVRMLTGDNILTAQHIARECGILDDSGVAMEGPDFRKLSQTEFDSILPRLQVKTYLNYANIL
jgi:Ca2+-transporting ATPase